MVDGGVKEAWETGPMDTVPGCTEFQEYMAKTYIDDFEALFQRDMWSHWETGHDPRTTNHVEGFHSKLNKMCPPHPNIYIFLDVLRTLQDRTEQEIRQLQNRTMRPPSKKAKYRDVEERLHVLRQRLTAGELTPLQFCDRAGYLLQSPE